MAKSFWEFTRFIWWMQTERQRQSLKPSQPTWPVSLPLAATIHIHHHHLLVLLSPKADTHFTVPQRVEGWVDLGTAVSVCRPWSRLYTAVAESCCDKHNCPRSLTPQSGMLPLDHGDTQRQLSVNNLLLDSAAAENQTRNHQGASLAP